MGYRLNRLDEPVFMAGPKPMRTEFGIHLRLEGCEATYYSQIKVLGSTHMHRLWGVVGIVLTSR